MKAPFRLYGAELSPYSVKVRSFLRFKRLEFEWLPRTGSRQDEFARYAKLPLIPVLVDADDAAMQDSTPILEALEARHPEPSAVPEDAALAFLSALLEDYADEWLNKAMFHYRWSYPEDRQSAARRIVEMIYEGGETPPGAEDAVRARMMGRLHYVGSSAETAPLIEASFARLLGGLEGILARRPYVFGARPALADFALAGQLWQLRSDPTPGAMVSAQAPNVSRWLDRIQDAAPEGDFVGFAAAAEDMAELLGSEIAGAYLPWMAANAQAVADDAAGVSVDIAGQNFVQKPQRYAAKAFAEIRRKRAGVDDAALAALLAETGCEAYLVAPGFAEDDEDGEAEDGADAASAAAPGDDAE